MANFSKTTIEAHEASEDLENPHGEDETLLEYVLHYIYMDKLLERKDTEHCADTFQIIIFCKTFGKSRNKFQINKAVPQNFRACIQSHI